MPVAYTACNLSDIGTAGDNGDDTINMISGAINTAGFPFGALFAFGGDDTVSIFDAVNVNGRVIDSGTNNAGGSANTNITSGPGMHNFAFAGNLTGNVTMVDGTDTVNLNSGNIAVSNTVLNETGNLIASTLSTNNLTFGLTDNVNFATLALTGGAFKTD